MLPENERAVWVSGEIHQPAVRRFICCNCCKTRGYAAATFPQFLPIVCNPSHSGLASMAPLGMPALTFWESMDGDIIWRPIGVIRHVAQISGECGKILAVGEENNFRKSPGFLQKEIASANLSFTYISAMNLNDPRSRRAQFTVFHELAHYLLDTLPADAPLLSAELEACEDRSAFEEPHMRRFRRELSYSR